MKKYILAIMTIAGLVSYYLFSFIPFEPLAFEAGSDEGYHAIAVNNDFYKKLSKVLTRYYVEHEVKDGKVFIRRTTSFDKDLIYNYTMKALRPDIDTTSIESSR